MLPFFAQKLLAVGGAITGHDAPQILKSTATATGYSLGNVTSVQVGDLVTVHLHGQGDSNVLNPTNFTATLGGVSMGAPINQTASTSSGVFVAGAAFQFVAGAAGNLALDVNMALACRGVIAVVWLERGYDAGTPRGLIHAPGSGTSSVTTQAVPPSGFTTGRNGNTYKVSVSIKGGDVTSVAMSGVDGSGTTTSGGTNATSDLSIAYGWKMTPTFTAIAPSASWTTSARAVGLGTETNL